MAETRIEPATEEHARNLAPRLRAEDRAEVWRSSRMEPLEALLTAVRWSLEAGALVAGEDVVAMAGIIPISLLTGTVQPWCLSSPLVERYPIAFSRAIRAGLAEHRKRFPVMLQVIDARYKRSVAWARRLGFDVSPAFLFGPVGYLNPHHLAELRS